VNLTEKSLRSPVGDERSRMLEVRVALVGAGWPIGSAVRVELPAARSSAGLVVPRDAVIVRADGAYVFRVAAGDVAEFVTVRGGERLRAGQAVTITTNTASAAEAARLSPPAS